MSHGTQSIYQSAKDGYFYIVQGKGTFVVVIKDRRRITLRFSNSESTETFVYFSI